MNETQDKRQGLRAEEDRPGFAYLNTDRGLAIACKAFDKTPEEIEAIVGRYSRGKRKGLLRGSIQWRRILRGGWVSGFGVVERGLEYGHSIQNWDGDVLFGYDARYDSRAHAISAGTDLAHPEAAEARKKAQRDEEAKLDRERNERLARRDRTQARIDKERAELGMTEEEFFDHLEAQGRANRQAEMQAAAALRAGHSQEHADLLRSK